MNSSAAKATNQATVVAVSMRDSTYWFKASSIPTVTTEFITAKATMMNTATSVLTAMS